MYTITKKEAIDVLVKNGIFTEEEINNCDVATEFYIEHLVDGWDICDVDRMAHLNTLFGYNIGADTAIEIDSYLWGNPDFLDKHGYDKHGCGIETLELSYKDKDLLKEVCDDLGLDLSFDKWRTTDFNCYEYY